jgi:hypothetical protein
MVGRFASLVVMMALGSALFGCSNDDDEREQCERMCDFIAACGEGAYADCTDAGIDNCVENIEDASDGCQTAIEDFTDCWDAHPTCEELAAECQSSLTGFVNECSDEFGA